MIIKVFLALPLFTEDEQTLFKGICMEFISRTSRLCTDQGNNPVYLIDKVPVMLRENMAPGSNEQYTYLSRSCQEKISGFSGSAENFRQVIIVPVLR